MTVHGIVSRRPASLDPERAALKRVGWVWALLLFNVLAFAVMPTVIPIPHKVGQALTQGALVAALVLALTVNPRAVVRPNLFLGVFSVLGLSSLMMSVRFVSIGTDYRAVRLLVFLAVLWLLTPWWGRPDFLLVRYQLRCMTALVWLALLGLVIAPGKAYSSLHRLSGVIWPMPPPQVAHYAAEAAGLTAILWLCGLASRQRALWVMVPCAAALALSHTRTALVAMAAGLVVAALSLVTTRRRVRKAFVSVLVVGILVGIGLTGPLTSWLSRGENTQQLTTLTGRTKVWGPALASPRPIPNEIFGLGLSNKGFDGLPIDNSWISTYMDQGVVGDVLVGLSMVVLLLLALFRPRGPARAMALFLIVYCIVASFTESGLGDASTYSLDLALAASLLMTPGPVLASFGRRASSPTR